MMPIYIFDQIRTLKESLSRLPGVKLSPSSHRIVQPDLELAVTDSELRKVVAKLFKDGHHARAVEEAFKFLNNLVKRRTTSTADGSALMKHVFSPSNPVLKINALVSESEKSEQLGYMEILSGVMTGIRNPRAHEHDWEDSEARALQLLTLANHLVLRVRGAT